MSALPVIQRELRVASRQRSTWQLRWAFVAAALLALAIGRFSPSTPPQQYGQMMLASLARCAFALSLLTGPFLTADCLSVEKREGTLGLLFLTRLSGSGIVIGKMAGHSLRVVCAWLAIFPCLFLPILHGGVLWAEVVRLMLVLLCGMLLSLAVGVFWSTVATEARTSVLATTITLLLVVFLPWLPAYARATFLTGRFILDGWALISPMTTVAYAFESSFTSSGPGVLGSGASLFWCSLTLSCLVSVALVFISGLLLPWTWRKSELTMRGGGSLHSLVRPTSSVLTYDWLPIGRAVSPARWLAMRRVKEDWWMNLLRWLLILFFCVMLVHAFAVKQFEQGLIGACGLAYGLHLITRIQAILSGTRRLYEARRTGTLEELLVTPVTEREVIMAHHESVFRSLRIGCWTLLVINIVLQVALTLGSTQSTRRDWVDVWFLMTALCGGGLLVTLSDFRTLRWLALREALRARTQIKAAGRVFWLLIGVPWIIFAVTYLVAAQFRDTSALALFGWLWIGGCLTYNHLLEGTVRLWLQPGLRFRIAETA
ncbi:MAG: hypothetical protein H7A46_18805 [Verrucomicrobiales bacterium]|nr:hypothetical protein [Planctomycetota bacterium]MCP5523593.1 hypothetical protein [Verrucomicrobiales bacterium]